MKKFLLFITFTIFALTSAFGQSKQTVSAPDSVVVNPAQLADSLISDAKKYLGRPYVWAANGPNAFDCSGLTRFVYGKMGYKLSRTVQGQINNGRVVEGGLHNLQKGDIIIYGSRGDKSRPGHVALFIELDSTKNEFTFIHAARTGVIISKSSERYYKERFLMAVRILPDFPPPAPEYPLPFEKVDSLYAEVVVPNVPDTLKLNTGDKRVVLFENGTWAILGEDGSLIRPNDEEITVVYGNGTWKNIPLSQKKIPVKRYDPPTATPVSQPVKKYHTVKSGDTLYALAVFYKTKVSEICRLNGIKETDILKLGTKLRVK